MENNQKDQNLNTPQEQRVSTPQTQNENKPRHTYVPLTKKQAFIIRSAVFAVLGIIILVYFLVKKYGG